MARGSSSPCPQQPTTCPYPEPHSVRVLPFYLYKINFNIIYIRFYASLFPNWSPRTEILHALLSYIRATCPSNTFGKQVH